jgi:hypothetical protein
MNEDWDDMAAAEPLAGEELERVLARFARVRLDPSPAQARRARGILMERAWRQRIDPTGSVAATAAQTPPRRLLFASWGVRRVAASLSAAVLAGLLVGSSAFAASRAGGPLYETRLALESLTLPSDPSERVDASLVQAQARLAEVVEAAGRHDSAATMAALNAYDASITTLLAVEGAPAERALEAIQLHRLILLEVAAKVPEGAANGLDRAIENSDRVITALGTPGPDTGAGAGNPNGGGNGNGSGNGDGNGATGGNGDGNGGGNGNGGTGGNGNGSGNGGPAPTPTAKPDRTPAPTPTATPDPTPHPTVPPKPTPTPKPDKTPRPHGTPDPAPQPTPRP